MMTNTLATYSSIGKISTEKLHELLKNESANFFQTIEALHFFSTVGLETFTYALEYNKKITAFVSGIIQKEKGVKSTFTRRAIIYGGPILSSEVEKEHIIVLFKTVVKQLKYKVIYIEIRNFNDYDTYKSVFDEIGFEYHPHLNFHLHCDTEEKAKKSLSSSKLRQIKKSLKEGATTREATTESEIEDFYKILSNLYKTKIKTPLPDLVFFTKLWSQDIAKFFLVFYDDKVVGGIVCPILKDKVIYEWYVCGEDGVHKNVYPSILATWSAIAYACQERIPRFDFMGAGKPNESYGVREFKSKFGGDLVEHGRFIYITNPLLYSLGQKAVRILKKW